MRLEGLRDAVGTIVAGRELGRGGEGAVYELTGRPGLALKLYFEPDAARKSKITAFVRGGFTAACPSAAVPRTLVRASDGAFVGFTMRMVDGSRPLHDLYGAASRRRHFPGADWRMIVRAAANVARSIAEVHGAGLVIGDINHSSMLVSQRSLVTLIDADSWQVGPDHACRVGVPEYTPPELQGLSLDGVVRTRNHDAFGLAVLIAQLLFLGRHPFAGVPVGQPLPLPEAIGRHQFAYTLVREVRLRPPRGTLLLSDLPASLRVGFERAFGSMLGPRYSPAQWAAALADLERDLVACPADALHWIPSGTSPCPWCRIERLTGRTAFGADVNVPAHPGLAPGRRGLDAVRSFVDGIDIGRIAGIEPPPSRQAVRASTDAVAFAAQASGAAHMALLDTVTELDGGVSGDRFTRRHIAAERALVRTLADWRRVAGVGRVLAGVAALRQELARVVAKGADALPSVQEAAAHRAVGAALVGARITDARVPGLAGGRRALLAAAGLNTAADLSRARLVAIVGLGAQCIAALLVWRDEVAASAGTRPADAAHMREPARPDAQTREGQRLAAMRTELTIALAHLELRVGTPDQSVERARAEVASAAADLRLLRLPLPGQGKGSPIAGAPPGKKTKGGGKRKGKSGAAGKANAVPPTCPKCGSAMARRWSQNTARRTVLGCTRYPACDGKRTVSGRRL